MPMYRKFASFNDAMECMKEFPTAKLVACPHANNGMYVVFIPLER